MNRYVDEGEDLVLTECVICRRDIEPDDLGFCSIECETIHREEWMNDD